MDKTQKLHVETRKFDAEISKVLQLMIHSLYTNKDIFLRELVSNAADAIDKLRYLSITEPSLSGDDVDYKVTISIDNENKTLSISDNGIGMNHDDMVENLGTIARSGTQNFTKNLTGDSQKDVQLIGQFGVGFYSSFMVANSVEVISKKAGTNTAYKWSSKGDGEFTIGEYVEQDHSRGTIIKLTIKDDSTEFLDKYRLKHIVTTYSDHINAKIYLKSSEEGKEDELLNTSSAIWTRSKNSVTEEDYKNFYKHIAHAGDEPWLTMHNKNEGKVEFTNLLFIPSSKPFDLYHPDRMTRVKLYVKKVFITEENISLIPAYLRFLKGVIDSEDLPLNISRETLQHNDVIEKIKKSVVKRTTSELTKIMNNDITKYKEFWQNFGPVLKEGLCEFTDNKEELLSLCLFYSSKNDDQITLKDYVANMPDKQNEIFYCVGDNIGKLKNGPQLEGFKKRGIDVLLLTDHVDDFWVNVAGEYSGKSFKSILKSGINLDDIMPLAEEDSGNKESKIETSDIEILTAFIKETLGEKVKDVIISNKLTNLPACLAVGEGSMDIRMEKFLKSQNQLSQTSQKFLEINPSHIVLKNILKLKDMGRKEKAEDTVWLMYDQACILEGEEIANIGDFSKRLTSLLEKEDV